MVRRHHVDLLGLDHDANRSADRRGASRRGFVRPVGAARRGGAGRLPSVVAHRRRQMRLRQPPNCCCPLAPRRTARRPPAALSPEPALPPELPSEKPATRRRQSASSHRRTSSRLSAPLTPRPASRPRPLGLAASRRRPFGPLRRRQPLPSLPLVRSAARPGSLTGRRRCACSRGRRIRKVAAGRSAAGSAVAIGRHVAAGIAVDASLPFPLVRACPAGAMTPPLAAARLPSSSRRCDRRSDRRLRPGERPPQSPLRSRRRRRRPCRPLRRSQRQAGAVAPRRRLREHRLPLPRLLHGVTHRLFEPRSSGIFELPIRVDEFVAKVRVPRTDRAQRSAVGIRPVRANDQQRIRIGQVGLTRRCRSVQLFPRRANRGVERIPRA